MAFSSVQTRLAQRVPSNVPLRAYHISTPPTPSPAIFSAAPGQADDPTHCEHHFLAIAVPADDTHAEILTFAIEILIFTTPNLTTVFVSKADSAGFNSLIKIAANQQSITRTVVETFIDFLIEPRLGTSRLVLSLFARSQDQYLFPGSIENAEKHVLDDRQLIKWWGKVLHTVAQRYHSSTSTVAIDAHLIVPGLDPAETKAFFPRRSEDDQSIKWTNDYPVRSLVPDDNAPPRCLIPRLPDDPKARFLNDLDNEYIGEHGEWRNVKTLADFWEFMSYRQECSAARLVGFIWIAFHPKSEAGVNSLEEAAPVSSDARVLLTPQNSQHQPQEQGMQSAAPADSGQCAIDPLISPPRSIAEGPETSLDPVPATHSIEPIEHSTVEPRAVKAGAESLETPTTSLAVSWPSSTRGQIVVDADVYQDLMDFLLKLDFTGQDLAAQSSEKWISKVIETCKHDTFGVDIMGSYVGTGAHAAAAVPSSAMQPTILTGVRKKRKPELPESSQSINTLTATSIRKKVKTA
jgi:regulator of Ty1 transposition protein 109